MDRLYCQWERVHREPPRLGHNWASSHWAPSLALPNTPWVCGLWSSWWPFITPVLWHRLDLLKCLHVKINQNILFCNLFLALRSCGWIHHFFFFFFYRIEILLKLNLSVYVCGTSSWGLESQFTPHYSRRFNYWASTILITIKPTIFGNKILRSLVIIYTHTPTHTFFTTTFKVIYCD